jgi:HlyD family secretion protein
MRRIPILITVLLLLSCTGCKQTSPTAIQASGQIEAKQIAVASEVPGRVVEVYVTEGDSVEAGDPLLRLDDSLMVFTKQAAQAAVDAANLNVQTAQSGLDSAQAQYNITLSTALAAEQITRQDHWIQPKPDEFNQPIWYFSRVEQIRSAETEVETAKAAMDQSQARLAEAEKIAGNSRFLETEKRLSNTRMAYDVAQTVLDQTGEAADGNELRDAAQIAFDNATDDLRNAQKDYDEALFSDGGRNILEARAEVEVARERYYAALDVLRTLQTGEYSLTVVAADKAVGEARALLSQAQSAVAAAQAELDLINAQMDMLTIRAALNGVVLVRSIEVGEVIQAGMPVLSIGKLDTLKVTVYIPESQYAQISLGQKATLTADSFPDQTFPAVVTRISDQAEFTPQNVQTKEGRQTTVYAIELAVDNPDGQLKPGLPVDVTF